MNTIFYAPDGETTSGGSSTNDSIPKDTHIRHAGNLPDKDANLLAVSETVSNQWAANNFMALVWKTQADFAADVALFSKQLASRNTEGGKRSQQTKNIDNLDEQMEDALPYVKGYTAEAFGPPNATAHYGEFGIVHRGASWELPRDRENRKGSLQMMVDAMKANGFDTKQYGTAWWTDIQTQYNTAVDAATAGSGNVSGDVSSMVLLRTTLRRVLHSVLLVLEANYPDTFDQVKRQWGFQKEKY